MSKEISEKIEALYNAKNYQKLNEIVDDLDMSVYKELTPKAKAIVLKNMEE